MKDKDYPIPGTVEYQRHLEEELDHFKKIFDGAGPQETLLQPVPPAWREVERRSAELIQQHTGNDEAGHVVTRLNQRPGVRMLSLGSGPCGVEIILAKEAPQSAIHCMDVNADLLGLGEMKARKEGLNITMETADLNLVTLPVSAYDYVYCHAALHHIVHLEHLAQEAFKTLRKGGEFIIVDIITQKGYLMWPETRDVVTKIFKTLPPLFRINHTGFAEPRLDEEIWESDTSEHGMECARSQDIIPVLEQNFTNVQYVPLQCLSRRFFDTMYGPNYDLSRPLDQAIFNWIWELDLFYLSNGHLKPEAFFGIYRKD